MALTDYFKEILPYIEIELKKTIDFYCLTTDVPDLYHMLKYHMGWEGDGSGSNAQGKRIRPVLVMLAAGAAGGDWKASIPGAVAVELVHNFSLIHDDIQDKSELRRGRATVWKIWGIEQAINAGDLLFTIAHRVLINQSKGLKPSQLIRASENLLNACTQLTEGQYLDLLYEKLDLITIDDYWSMVSRKTAALLACSMEMGAILSGAKPDTCKLFNRAGLSLGLAFQAWDDWLGLWGDPGETGKPVGSDLLSGKKTLPVIFALSKNQQFAHLWGGGQINLKDVQSIKALLEIAGAKIHTEEMVVKYSTETADTIKQIGLNNNYSEAILELINLLIRRKN